MGQESKLEPHVSAISLDWFTFKTNMKLLVLDMIEPTVKLARA
jgi:hypothetical protein